MVSLSKRTNWCGTGTVTITMSLSKRRPLTRWRLEQNERSAHAVSMISLLAASDEEGFFFFFLIIELVRWYFGFLGLSLLIYLYLYDTELKY